LYCLTLEDGNDSLSQSVGNKQLKLHNIPDERKFHLHSSGNLKSGANLILFTW